MTSAGPKCQMTVCTCLQADNHAKTSSLSFYGLNALSDAKPTVSKYCSQTDTDVKKRIVA